MKRAKQLPTTQLSAQVPDVVRELCDSIEAAATAGEFRRAVARGLELFEAGDIDTRGMAQINRVASKAMKAALAHMRSLQPSVTAAKGRARGPALGSRK